MNSRIVLLIAVPAIVVVVLALTFLGVFSSPIILAVIVVLYAVVSIVNRRKFGRQSQDQKPKQDQK